MQTHAAEASPMGPTVQRAQLVKTKCGDITRLFLQISVPELFLKELKFPKKTQEKDQESF